MPWRSTRARPSSTAASPPGSTASCSVSWSTATRNGFYDEGEETWPKRYAIWGRLVAQQPDQIAYTIVDAKSFHLFMPSIFPAIQAPTIGELAGKLALDPAALEKTVADFNAAVRPGTFDHTVLDDCAHRRPDAAEIALGARRSTSRRSTPIRCAPASPSPISACG